MLGWVTYLLLVAHAPVASGESMARVVNAVRLAQVVEGPATRLFEGLWREWGAAFRDSCGFWIAIGAFCVALLIRPILIVWGRQRKCRRDE